MKCRIHRAVPWLRRCVAGLSPRRAGFDPRSVSVRFAVEKVAVSQVSLPVLLFSPCQHHSNNAPLSPVSTIPPVLHSPLSALFHQCSTLPCQHHSTNAPLSPVNTIPPMLHSPLSAPFHQCSTLPCQHHSTNAPLSPVSIIPPMLHSPLSAPFHQCSTLPCQHYSTNAP